MTKKIARALLVLVGPVFVLIIYSVLASTGIVPHPGGPGCGVE